MPLMTALESAFQDLRYALRGMRRSQGFTLVAVLSLALGIGANTAVFSLVHAVLLRPLPYPGTDRIVQINREVGGAEQHAMSIPQWEFLKNNATAFSAVAGYRGGGEEPLVIGTERQWIRTALITTDFFRALGVQPVLGREFHADETRPNGPRAIVLTYKLWQRSFNSDPAIIGRIVTLENAAYTITGVLPKGFWFPPKAVAFIPLRPTGGITDTGANTTVIARIRPGISIAQADAEMPAMFESYHRAYPQLTLREETGVSLQPFHDAIVGDVSLSLWLLFGAAALLLAIACSNVASLLLARLAARQKEIAIRTALGGGSARLARQFLIENLALSLTGAAAGVFAAYLVLASFVAIVPFDLPASAPIHIDGTVLLYALAVAIGSGVLFGLAPLLTSRRDLNKGLSSGGRNEAGGNARQGVRNVLVTGQVALSVALLVASGLLIQTLYRLSHERLGFKPEGLITFSTPFSADLHHNGAWSYERTLLEHLQAVPGVRAAAGINVLPLEGQNNYPGQRDGHPDQSVGGLEYRVVTPNYFDVMGIPIVRGRGFSADDKNGSTPVVLVNQTLAQTWWPDGNALGDRISVGRFHDRVYAEVLEPPRSVVGVVADTKTVELKDKPRPTIYVPAAQALGGKGTGEVSWVLRANATAGITEAIRHAIAEVDPGQRVLHMQTMTGLVASATSDTRFDAWLLGSFAGLALALTAIGIYGLLSFSVAKRRQEIGTRLALGAESSDIFNLVLKQGLRLTAVGLVLGLAGALAFTRILKNLLFGVAPTDPLSFAAVAIVLLAVGLFASYLPARRATKVDPIVTLRYE